MSRQRLYATTSVPMRRYDSDNSQGYSRDYPRDIEDRRDYRPPDRYSHGYDDQRPYHMDRDKPRPPSRNDYDRGHYDIPPPRRRDSPDIDTPPVSRGRHTYTDEQIAFIVKTEREVTQPIGLLVAPPVPVSESWD